MITLVAPAHLLLLGHAQSDWRATPVSQYCERPASAPTIDVEFRAACPSYTTRNGSAHFAGVASFVRMADELLSGVGDGCADF